MTTGIGKHKAGLNDVFSSCLLVLAFLLLLAVILVPTIILYGFVAMKYWVWFVTPYFGFPPIDIWLAGGLVLFSQFLFFDGSDYVANKKKSTAELAAMVFGRPLLYLFFGWVIHFFV